MPDWRLGADAVTASRVRCGSSERAVQARLSWRALVPMLGAFWVWFVHTSQQPLMCLLMSIRAKPRCVIAPVWGRTVLVAVVVLDAQ